MSTEDMCYLSAMLTDVSARCGEDVQDVLLRSGDVSYLAALIVDVSFCCEEDVNNVEVKQTSVTWQHC